MAPKHAKLQIFIQANLYFFQNIHRWKKTKTCQEQPNFVCGRLIQVFHKMTTTFPRRPLLSGPKSGHLIQVWLYLLTYRSWHDVQANARTCAVTHAHQEKGGLGRWWKVRPKVKLHWLILPAPNSKWLFQN